MSARSPEDQDLRWPYEPPEDLWPPEAQGAEMPGQFPVDSGQWSAMHAEVPPGTAQFPAVPAGFRTDYDPPPARLDEGRRGERAPAAGGWSAKTYRDPDPGDDDDDDYQWIRYLTGGNAAPARPGAPARDPAGGAARPDRPAARPERAHPGSGRPASDRAGGTRWPGRRKRRDDRQGSSGPQARQPVVRAPESREHEVRAPEGWKHEVRAPEGWEPETSAPAAYEAPVRQDDGRESGGFETVVQDAWHRESGQTAIEEPGSWDLPGYQPRAGESWAGEPGRWGPGNETAVQERWSAEPAERERWGPAGNETAVQEPWPAEPAGRERWEPAGQPEPPGGPDRDDSAARQWDPAEQPRQLGPAGQQRRARPGQKTAAAGEKHQAREAAKSAAAERKRQDGGRKRQASARKREDAGARRAEAERTATASGGPERRDAGRKAAATRTAAVPEPAAASPRAGSGPVAVAEAAPASRRARAARRKRARRMVTIVGLAIAALVVAAVAASAVVLRSGRNGVSFTVAAPRSFGGYKQAPAIAGQMKLPELRSKIADSGRGEARHVIDAVYEDTTGPAARNGPQFIVLIAGNLAGASANSFVSSFVGKLPGAVATSPGRPASGAAAACAPSRHGSLAECAWADGDTFGVLGSSTLTAADLGRELRQLRPLVEQPAR